MDEAYRNERAGRAVTGALARRVDTAKVGYSFNYNVDEYTTPQPPPRPSLLCRLGFHREYVGTTARAGWIKFLWCQRRGCPWTAIRKG